VPRGARPLVLALAVCAGLVMAATLALWAHYGTAVFVETIVAGINACF
jgi:membrane-associated phospholipid phosphatase